MKDNTRVSLSIVVWILLFVGFVAMGIHGITHIDAGGEVEIVAASNEQRIERVAPDSVGLDSCDLRRIAPLVEEHVARGTFSGAVVAVVRGDKLAYIKAFGSCDDVPMSEDVRFDLASLTKPVVVATAVMQLVERGMLRLSERVSGIIPDFEGWHDEEDREHAITILDLMTHTSCLPSYVSIERLCREYPDSAVVAREELMDYITHCDRELPEEEGASRYSCLNYIALGAVVEKIAGMSLDEYADKYIFEPLDMHDTCFTPTDEYAALCVPTSPTLCGVVHDPLAREIMGGVSGNAGLFSTAEDLAIYAAMLLCGGTWQGVEVLSPLSVDAMFALPYGYDVAGRTLGWRAARSVYVAAGDLLAGDNTIVHTGATGTSIVVNRRHNIAIIILTNRTLGTATATDIHDLRSKVCNVVAAAIR